MTRLARGSARVSPARPFHDPVVAGRAIRRWGAYAFNKQATALRAAFNENLAAVQARPIWRNTLKRFGLDDHAIDQVSARSTEQLCRRP